MKPNLAKGLWERLSPGAKRGTVLVGAVLALFAVLVPFSAPPPANERGRATPQSIDNILTSADTRELGLSGVSRDVDRLRQDLATAKRTITELQSGDGNAAPSGPDSEARREIATLRAELEQLRQQVSTPRPASTPSIARAETYTPGRTGTPVDRIDPNQPPQVSAKPIIRTLTGTSTAKPSVVATTAPTTEPGVYVPSGAMLSGVLLTGLDAPTGRVGQSNPIPVLVRLKDLAILPNRFRADVRECFVLMDGIGDIASERAMLRAQTISCVRVDGGVIDTRLEAYAVGEDGSAGLRGLVQSKQSQAIMRATIAAFADGVARAFSPGVSVYGGVGDFSAENSLRSGGAAGVSGALDRVSKYYLDLATTMLPVVTVHPGRPVTLIVVRGTRLELQDGSNARLTAVASTR